VAELPKYVDYAEYYDYDYVGGPMTEDISFYMGYA